MGIFDIIYHMVNKSPKKKKKKKTKKKVETKEINKEIDDSVQKLEQKIVVKDLSDTNKLIKAWQESVKTVSDHPLSQVKIINTQILEQLTTILESMNMKLDKLALLDEIIDLLKESRTEIKIVGGSTEKIDKAIAKLEALTIKDEEVIKVLNDKGPMTAEELSRVIGISRSTASSRLNRLNKFGIVRKKADGKLIYYSLYSEDKK